MALSAEAELAALFITIEMGWPQLKSPIQTDNSTAAGFT